MSTLKNVFMVGWFTMVSRFLGLAREMLQSRLIGAGIEQSAFTLAFAIPNMARKLFGEGALTAAFVPVFKGEVESVGLEKASRLARAVITMMLLMVGAVVAIGFVALFVVGSATVAPESQYRMNVTVKLIAILLPYMLAICGAAFGMGVLNALGRFKASSFMPALLNIIWIVALCVLLLIPDVSASARIYWVAGAILLGGFAQMAFMFVCMSRVGVRPLPLFRGWRSEKVRLVWRNTFIAALGAGAVQINYMLDQVLGQLAAPWAAGVIGYAERLMDLPLGVIGVAFGTVLLPTFSGFFAKNDVAGARDALRESVVQQMFVMIPAAFGLAVVAPVVTEVIYQGGSFDAVATTRVSRALAVYALGLGFFGLQKSLIPWFQAQNDMKTPLHVSVITVIVNATLNVLAVFLLPQEWRHVGLAVSTVVCAALGCAIFIMIARARKQSLGFVGILPYLAKVVLASLVMASAVYAVDHLGQHVCAISRLVGDMAVGGLVYFPLSFALKTNRFPWRRRRRK